MRPAQFHRPDALTPGAAWGPPVIERGGKVVEAVPMKTRSFGSASLPVGADQLDVHPLGAVVGCPRTFPVPGGIGAEFCT
jgi:hypothetical protein